MTLKSTRWESQLWSCVGSGDGENCPLYNQCQNRSGGGWCPFDYKERLHELQDARRFSIKNYDFIECGPQTDCRLFKMAEMLTREWLREGDVQCPPVPTELILQSDKLNLIEVRKVPLRVYHGAIWHLGDGWVIHLKDDDSPAVQRFTLFHEAFHILAHCKTTPVFSKRGTSLGSFNELLANFFSVSVLMPEEWVRGKWAEVKDINKMAAIFDVPKPAMCIRLKGLGLI